MDNSVGGPQVPQDPQKMYDGGPGTMPAPPPRPAAGGSRFFTWLRSLGVRRGEERWIGGVASGLAERWGIDPVIVRGLVVVLSLFFGIGVLAYGLAWALLPEPDGRIHAEEAGHGRWSTGMTGAVVFTALGLASPGRGVVFGAHDGWFPWGLLWIGAVVWLVVWAVNRDKRRNAPGPVPPTPPYAAPFAAPAAGTADFTAPYAAPAGPSAAGPQGGPWGGPWGPPQGRPQDPAALPWNGTEAFTATAGRVGAGVTDWSKHTLGPEGPLGPNGPLAQRRHPRWGAGTVALALGLALLAGATVLLLDSAAMLRLGGYGLATALAASAGVLGLCVVVAGFLGRRSGLPGFLAVLALAAAVALSVVPASGSWTLARSQTWQPVGIVAAENGFTAAASHATVDLTRLGSAPLAQEVSVPVTLAASEVDIVVPANVPVTIESQLVASSISYNGQKSQSLAPGAASISLNPQATGHRLTIVLRGAAGSITVTTSGAGAPASPTAIGVLK
ncbi:PspC domain-containing protein [Pseudarthrobacter sp. P1]|uniref:PspC domain-containing protein n=1 Tax=Pseudarthrobacter sp. P1 TaxID=3418418 RepID=UPI003CF16B0A